MDRRHLSVTAPHPGRFSNSIGTERILLKAISHCFSVNCPAKEPALKPSRIYRASNPDDRGELSGTPDVGVVRCLPLKSADPSTTIRCGRVVNMGPSVLAQAVAVLLVVQALPAAEPAVKTTWSEFQQQVTQGRLNNRAARISTSAGDQFNTVFLGAVADFLVVTADRKTKQWATKNGEATIPRDSVSTVRFSGKTGRRGLIGGLYQDRQ